LADIKFAVRRLSVWDASPKLPNEFGRNFAPGQRTVQDIASHILVAITPGVVPGGPIPGVVPGGPIPGVVLGGPIPGVVPGGPIPGVVPGGLTVYSG